jgi:hypothetical protein
MGKLQFHHGSGAGPFRAGRKALAQFEVKNAEEQHQADRISDNNHDVAFQEAIDHP